MATTTSSALHEPLLDKDLHDDDGDATDDDDDDDDDNRKSQAIILARLKPMGAVATDGMASKYADTFTPPLERLMTEKEFRVAIGAINQTVADYFPCMCCVVYAYVGYALTCGLILCCARPCTSEVDLHVRRVLRRINRKDIFQNHGIRWRLRRTRWTSWIEVSHSPEHDIRRIVVTIPDVRRMSVPIPSSSHRPSSRPASPVGGSSTGPSIPNDRRPSSPL
ncbi:hypothetical protein H257_07180 [Aphanomyces astaci]|uniref:Golgin subfamily A member 7/ERF4 domain-containing protein n=1 Tax=Aphanomyces astaci TaxID=112090 RepID=W4GJW4_APHAT|nr:hypothetical protein H257_07180 [Aphanomyces astaci]ETV79985.1 hypothetical protein H257_07180 [Aphanomyces astaci]|eukprot:XP_009830921.1 hypothetical protein H257_07180 [Aphanomyces astaci]